VKANNSEKSKTVSNNSYISKTGPVEEENAFGTRGKRQIYPESLHQPKIQDVFNMPGQTSSVSSSYLYRGKNFMYVYVRKRVVLKFNGNITFNNKICNILITAFIPTHAHMHTLKH
jgi:hypothetical protein